MIELSAMPCRASAPRTSASVTSYAAVEALHALVSRQVDQHAAREDRLQVLDAELPQPRAPRSSRPS